MARHTPGPWSVAPYPEGAELLEVVADYSELPGGRKSAHWIAELDAGGIDDDRETNAANARLIAAAPELLEALKDASRTLKTCLSACNEKRTMGIQAHPCLVCRINAAIAKAEGK
jgi:hypothetical protein